MEFDLSSLANGNKDYIEVDERFSFPDSYFEKSEIVDLINLNVTGTIELDHELYPDLNLKVVGTMILKDSISLEDIEYDFEAIIEEKMEEKLRNLQNTIDIMDILWQNILLEVPLKLTEVEDLSQYQGEGWKLVSEDELISNNNPFKDLKDMLGEE